MVTYSDQSPVTFADPLPQAVDVVVIGGGVIGISTAWFLIQQGASVLVCDKGRVAGEQSSRNWGWIRQQGRDADELPIVIDSINAWERIAAELDDDIGFTRKGVLYTATTERELAGLERWLDIATQHQLDTQLLSSTEVDALVDTPPGQFVGGLFTPSDGRAEPFKAVPGIARAVQRRGGIVREACAVRALDMEGGRVTGVITEAGRVRTQAVVCAAGAWSTVFLRNLGIDLPQLTVRATVARMAVAPDIYQGNATLGGIAIRRRQDGGYTVAAGNTNEHLLGTDSFRYAWRFRTALAQSARYVNVRFGRHPAQGWRRHGQWGADDVTPFERTRVLNPAPSATAVRAMRAGLTRHAPALAGIGFEEAWAGMIDVTPDVVPVMDQIATHPGLYLATGFSGHGFGIGPGAGRIMADLVTGKPSGHDLTRFRFARFSDGSVMRPGPGL
jgi:glycine/D-amino acid oxidase-like deaminating enzyme